MKAIFAGIGGHGLFTRAQEDEVPLIDFTLAKDEQGGTIKVKKGGATVVTIDGGERPKLPGGLVRPALGPATLAIRGDARVDILVPQARAEGIVEALKPTSPF